MQNFLILTVTLFTLTSCFKAAIGTSGQLTKGGELSGLTATTQLSEDGNKGTAYVNASSKEDLLVTSPKSSAVAELKIRISPGTLAVPATLIFEESIALGDTALVSNSGLSTDIAVQGVGQGVIIRPSEPAALLKPMQISLPLPTLPGLNLVEKAAYAIFYQTQDPTTGKILTGVLPVDGVNAALVYDTLSQKDTIQFSGYFGSYWPVLVSRSIQVSEIPPAKETKEPIVNKSLTSVITQSGVVAEALVVKTQAKVPVILGRPLLNVAVAARSFQLIMESYTQLKACVVDVATTASADRVTTFETGVDFKYVGAITEKAAHQISARYRCRDEDDKVVVSPWSVAVSVAALSTDGGTAGGSNSGNNPTSGSGTTSNATLPTINSFAVTGVASDGYINSAESTQSGALWALSVLNETHILFSDPLVDSGNSVTCGANQTYPRNTIPAAHEITSDGLYVLCAQVSNSEGVVYRKSDSLLRDTVAPVFTSLNAANEANDGFINANEKNSGLLAWSLTASGHTVGEYSSLKDDTAGGSVFCTASDTYSNSIPTIMQIGSDGRWAICVRLRDSAGNFTYGKSTQIRRKIDLPTVSVASKTALQSSPSLTGTVSDIFATIKVTVNSANYPATNNTDGTWTLPAGTLPPLNVGQYNVSVIAKDVAGNEGSYSLANGLIMPPLFVSEWNTSSTSSGSSTVTQIKLPLVSGGAYNFVVDWGDSTSDTITQWDQTAVTHNYANAGIYTIRIAGDIQGWAFNLGGDRLKLKKIIAWGPLRFGNTGGYFAGASDLTITATDTPNLTGTTSLYKTFYQCAALTSVPNINAWNTSAITNMGYMFAGATNFNSPLQSWNTAMVTNMEKMFLSAVNFNQPIGTWTVTNVLNMTDMFNEAKAFNQNLGWNVGKVTSMAGMFQNAWLFNGDISNWDVSKVTNMNIMFSQAKVFNRNLSSWNVSMVTNMSGMFEGAIAFDQDVSSWNIVLVNTMASMFAGVTLSVTNYDALLQSWSGKTVLSNVTFDAGNSRYSSISPVIGARATLVTGNGWSITDGGSI